jgi:heat-inducible transcriptional repressor
MTSPPVSELTERARAIFRLVVEGYIDSGHPGRLETLAEGGISLSPASIRSVLSELEILGLLAAPHTSAGRMPTELGLRLFVDGMMQVAEPSAEERAAIERRLAQPGPIEARSRRPARCCRRSRARPAWSWSRAASRALRR